MRRPRSSTPNDTALGHVRVLLVGSRKRHYRCSTARHPENAVETFVSAASAWEIMTKWRSAKQPEFTCLASTFVKVVEAHGFNQLPISVEHALQAASLPLHHRDPFDRMLIAQSLIENMRMVTPDVVFDQYGVNRIW